MINANELRIGNWVLESGEASMIYSIDRGGITFYRINDLPVHKETGAVLNTGEDKFKPIPLTPEILERCGEYNKGFIIDEYRHVDIIGDGYPVLFQFPEMSSGELQTVSLNKIDYLHQYQNLIFALTGKELTFKP